MEQESKVAEETDEQKKSNKPKSSLKIPIIATLLASLIMVFGIADTIMKRRELINILTTAGYNMESYIGVDGNIDDIENCTGTYINMINNEIDERQIEEAIKAGKNVGIIVTPTGYDYVELYKTIDVLKEVMTKYQISLPIFYNVDALQGKDETCNKINAMLAYTFLEKLEANGVFVGLYGTRKNMDAFSEVFEENIGDYMSLYTLFVNMSDDRKNAGLLDEDWQCRYIETDGKVYSNSSLADIIERQGLNSKDNFGSDLIYEVQPGDSLWTIAEKFGIGYNILAKYNSIDNPDAIYIDQKIVIPNVVCINGSEINIFERKNGTALIGKSEVQRQPGTILLADISTHQKGIDMEVLARNVDAVMVRATSDLDNYCGFDGHNNANHFCIHEDYEFGNHIEEIHRLGIPYGLYFAMNFAFLSDEQIQEEVRFIVDTMEKYGCHPELPIYIDIEPETAKLGNREYWQEHMSYILGCLDEELASRGYDGIKTGVYYHDSYADYFEGTAEEYWEVRSGENYNKKIAFEDLHKYTNDRVTELGYISQITQNGRIDGIGPIDLNIAPDRLLKTNSKRLIKE